MSELNQWIRHELAAIRIQRVYRQWRCYLAYKQPFRVRAQAARGFGCLNILKHAPQVPTPSPSECIQALIEQRADWNHQTAFWRTIIEIRRAFPNTSNDLIIKALMEAQGEISRAHILLGTKEFCLQHKKNLPESVRTMLLPQLGPPALSLSNPFLGVMGGRQTSPSDDLLAHWAESRRRNDVVRTLRNQRKQQKRQEILDKLGQIMDKSFFPREESHARPASSAGRMTSTASSSSSRPKTPTLKR